MNIQYCKKFAIAIALSGGLVTQAHANSCGDISPLKEKLGDQYELLNYSAEEAARDTDLTDSDLDDLIKSSDLRHGHGVRNRCFGIGSAERAVTTKFTLEDIVKVETARGNVRIKAFEESSDKLSSALIDLPQASLWKATKNNSYTTTQLFRRLHQETTTTELDDLRLDFFPVHLQINGKVRDDVRSTQQAEITLTLNTSPDNITLTETIYVGGLITDWVTWEIKR